MPRPSIYLFMIFALSGGFTAAFLDTRSARQVADDFYERYWGHKECNNTKGEKKPAYQGTGILIRGVPLDILAQAWKLKPGNEVKESFSVSFLRAEDAEWSQLSKKYAAGFFLYPLLYTPQNKNRYKVLCGFPINGSTDRRAGHGCGKSEEASDSPNSGHCDQQGIITFHQWRQHFQTEAKGISNRRVFMRRQCSFNMTLSSPKAAQLFEAVLAASKYLKGEELFKYRHNEILFHAWNSSPENAKNLPIEAFFYREKSTNGTNRGKNAARRFQAEYKRLTNEERPILGVQLPGPGASPKFNVWHLQE